MSGRNNICSSFLYTGLFIVVMLWASVSAAQDFGRLFTTPNQRERLDEIRNVSPEVIIEISDQELSIEDEVETIEKKSDIISVKGIVYRSDGKHTAWVNDSNSYEGDVASQYTDVGEEAVDRNGVQMNLPGKEQKIKIRVGEEYDPVSEQTRDLVPADSIVE